MKRILIKQKDQSLIIEFNDLVYCKSDNNYCNLKLFDGRLVLVSKSLSQFSRLIGEGFIRISQKYLVNATYIIAVNCKEKQVVFSNGEKLKFTKKYSEICSNLESALSFLAPY